MTYPPQSIFVPPRVATLLVAASNSLDRSRAQADYICDGVADHVQINAALNALPASGGRVVLSEGTFTIDDPITFPANNLTLEGQGRGTFIDGDGLATGEHGIIISAKTNCAVRNLAIQTEDGGGKTCHCIFIEDGANRFLVEGVIIVNSDYDGIAVEGTTINGGKIIRCEVLGADNGGIDVNMDADNYMYRLIVDGCVVLNAYGGVALTRVCHSIIINNIIKDSTSRGMCVGFGEYTTITGNIVLSPNNEGILVNSSVYVVVSNNFCYGSSNNEGIRITGESINCVVSGNICGNNQDSSGINVLCDHNKVIGNFCFSNGQGIGVTGAYNSIIGNYCHLNLWNGIDVSGSYCQIEGNYVYHNGQAEAAGWDNGIALASGAGYSSIIGNVITQGATSRTQEDCIHLKDGCTNVHIVGNHCSWGLGSGIALEANNDDCNIQDNYCYENDDYGIEITAATCDRNVVKNNRLIGNTAGCILDNGVNTGLAAFVAPFSDGSDPQDSGYLLDADTEYARAWMRLPAEVQQVVRLKIYARAGALSAAAMRLEINVNGGADNEPFNTHATAAPNTPSTSTNFAADDAIFWTLTAAGIVALLGGDTVEVKVLHEAAGDGDIATNAYIRTVEIEYV